MITLLGQEVRHGPLIKFFRNFYIFPKKFPLRGAMYNKLVIKNFQKLQDSPYLLTKKPIPVPSNTPEIPVPTPSRYRLIHVPPPPDTSTEYRVAWVLVHWEKAWASSYF